MVDVKLGYRRLPVRAYYLYTNLYATLHDYRVLCTFSVTCNYPAAVAVHKCEGSIHFSLSNLVIACTKLFFFSLTTYDNIISYSKIGKD